MKFYLSSLIDKNRSNINEFCNPQGSPLSPLLSNILLNELDKLLESRKLRYVRYADDFSVYVKSKKAAKRVGNNLYLYLKQKLRLPINRQKSGIRRPLTFTILGHSFVASYKKGSKGKYQLVVEKSKWKTFKAKLKMLTKKTIPAEFDERIHRINLLVRGWINYYKQASIQAKLKKLEEWLSSERSDSRIQKKRNHYMSKSIEILHMASLEKA